MGYIPEAVQGAQRPGSTEVVPERPPGRVDQEPALVLEEYAQHLWNNKNNLAVWDIQKLRLVFLLLLEVNVLGWLKFLFLSLRQGSSVDNFPNQCLFVSVLFYRGCLF